MMPTTIGYKCLRMGLSFRSLKRDKRKSPRRRKAAARATGKDREDRLIGKRGKDAQIGYTPDLLVTTNHAFGPPSLNVKSFRPGRTSNRVGSMHSITQPWENASSISLRRTRRGPWSP